ncbi:hypothetical protein BH09PAT1_BH09PAT1_2280 [soil metagenome]
MEKKSNQIIRILLLSFFVFFYSFFISTGSTYAHQPRIATNSPIRVLDPEVSKAYYGKLEGQEAVYEVQSDKPFDLYVNVLVPDIEGQKKDVSAVIFKEGTALPIATLNGTNFRWKKFFEEFGHDNYWQGPEYKAQVEAGSYKILVYSSYNDSKYSLAIGEVEAFDFKEGMNALTLIPQIKRDFFSESPIGFILSPFGYGLIFVMFALAFIFGFIYRFILKYFTIKSVRAIHKNIGSGDRLIRMAIGFALLMFAITTSWNPIILFFAGFAFFEAIFSWCGFYAAIGKNSCPIN